VVSFPSVLIQQENSQGVKVPQHVVAPELVDIGPIVDENQGRVPG
jgi:hypothetical protein